ncbi:hypothetical protein [Thalassolituus oleivorans]|uniref:hypothetical protein n=1 Tax=Thalassolituus oleivorans TaxID=187493 RepID=UPI0030C81879|tara:strand:- start:5908 stop:7149 length:1242 start_codon:yes stop_codon:yes gene_type:complete
MKFNNVPTLLLFMVAGLSSASLYAKEPSRQELVDRIDLLESELKQLRQDVDNNASKESLQVISEKIDGIAVSSPSDTLIHMAGYADVGYIDQESSDGSFGVGSFSPIFHFQYRDLVMLESELEIEVDDAGETETNLEYLTIDWFINDYMALIAGKFLSPIGQFRQNLHPSWINKLPSAPPGFGHDGAAPVSEVGVQLRGAFPVANMRTNYALYVGNGPELLTAFEDGEYELDGVEAEGKGTDADGEKVMGGRFGVIPVAGLELGLSAAMGKATVTAVEDGDSSLLSGEGVRDYDVLGADLSWSIQAFNFRGEYVETKVGDDIGSGTAASEGATWTTWYAQTSWRPGQSSWELVARYTDFDSPHNSQDQQQWAVGLNYIVASNFIAKMAYEFNDGESGSDAELDRLLLQLAYGF